MTKTLKVYLHNMMIGRLHQNKHGEMSFTYDLDWLNHPKSHPISQSLPLKEHAYPQKQCRPFFAGLLPEENQRKLIARNLGISANNDFSMLQEIGRECAGAISFIPDDETINISAQQYHKINDQDFAHILSLLPLHPLLAGEDNVRLSLAGVQDKTSIYIKNDKVYIPMNGAPSSHIIKPDSNFYEDLICNEAFCLKLAKQIGLTAVDAEIRNSEEIAYLIIKRYDRYEHNGLKRIHQEDFCQALGIVPERKYQNEGGPSLGSCIQLIREISATPITDFDQFISAVIFNMLIGNCDAHGKNFSILYHPEIQLAPLYDLVCTLYYPNLTSKMAMKIGGEYDAKKINKSHLEKMASEIEVSSTLLLKHVYELSDKTISVLDNIEINTAIEDKLQHIIRARCHLFNKKSSR